MPIFANVVNFQRIPSTNFVVYNAASAPTGSPGYLWYDTTNSLLKFWNGSAWVSADYAAQYAAGSITDTAISATANIALSKLAVNPLARANHTGTQLAATISDFDTQVRTSRLDQLTPPTATVNANGQKITGLADPTLASDAATKNYVDNARAGLAGVKDPVRSVATGNVTLTAPGTSVGGFAMTAGDSFLATAQTTGTENGIYVWNGAAVAATRRSDSDSTGEIQDGTMVAVSDGTYAGYQFIQTATPSGAPGTWTMAWQTFTTGGQTYTAGTGLSLSGGAFSLQTPVSLANGGTGGTTAAAARTSLGAVGKYVQTLGAISSGANTTVTHNLNTVDTIVQFKTNGGGLVYIDWAINDANSISFAPDVALAAGYKVVVIG